MNLGISLAHFGRLKSSGFSMLQRLQLAISGIGIWPMNWEKYQWICWDNDPKNMEKKLPLTHREWIINGYDIGKKKHETANKDVEMAHKNGNLTEPTGLVSPNTRKIQQLEWWIDWEEYDKTK